MFYHATGYNRRTYLYRFNLKSIVIIEFDLHFVPTLLLGVHMFDFSMKF